MIAASLVAAAGLFAPTLPAVAATGQAQSPTDRLQVWNLNTHGMDTGTNTNYRQFVDYITDASQVIYMPDIVTIQEAGTAGEASCQQFATDLEARVGLDYNCYQTTLQGGAAIVYRTGRLSYVGGTMKSIRLEEISTTSVCSLSSWYALVLRLTDDKNAGHFINVASVHLPTANVTSSTGNVADCSWDNMKIVSPAVTGLGSAAMQIMAGDWNHPDATTSGGQFSFWECEYAGTNVDVGTCGGQNLGWKDAMYRACGSSGAAAYNCLHTYHWTHGSAHARIDFLFAKAYAIYNQVTVDWAAAYASAGSPPGVTTYSDHRGQGSLLRYY
ncbi:MAG: hypothetical protein ACJ74U_06650 [Jatrophihabitantaceae bacterium]